MALLDEVTSRVPAETLVALTRPKGNPATQTVDTAILQKACDDAEAEFQTHLQATYTANSTDRRFVLLAVDLVLWILRKYSPKGPGNEALEREWDAWKKRADALVAVTARARVTPITSSELTPEDEVSAGESRAPKFGPNFWRGYQPQERVTGG